MTPRDAEQSTTTCLICGGALEQVLLEHDTPDRFELHVGIPTDGYRRVWRACGTCGSATNEHDPANLTRLASLSDSYYEVDFAGSNPAEKFARVMAMPSDRSDNAGRVERVFAMVWRLHDGSSAPIRAVDVGAGLGVFLARLIDRGREVGLEFDATGVEPDPTAAAHLRSVGSFGVHEGLFTGQAKLADAELITLNKVVEHVAEPLPLLTQVAESLAPAAGLAYVEVPDVATIGNRPPSDNILGALHHHLYSPEGLALLLRRAGLHPLQVARVFEPSGKITVFGFAVHRGLLDRLAAANLTQAF